MGLISRVSSRTYRKKNMTNPTVIHWFRKGLRFHDNPALLSAINLSNEKQLTFKSLFIIDPHYGKKYKVGANRWRFLHQTLVDLDKTLKKHDSRLFVAEGEPSKIIKTLIKDWNVQAITFEDETEPYPQQRDIEIKKLCKQEGVEVITKQGHTLWNPEEILMKNSGTTPMTYSGFSAVAEKLKKPAKPLDAPEEIPSLNKFDKDLKFDKNYKIPKMEDLAERFDFDMKDLGEKCKFPGGETEALKRLEKNVSMKRAKWVREFEKPKTSPNSLKPCTTVLSPHLMYGSLSCRVFYWRLKEIYATGSHAQPPVSLYGQLLWRDFFISCGANIQNFDKMKGNPKCKQIDWDDDEDKLNKWKEGKTGFPFIDAIMIQLKQEGWIHHLARHAVACFLTRGDLWQSWEKGMLHFEEMLLDADWSLNAANWQWLSASAFFHQYYRVYSPIAFGKKTDKEGEFIKKYLPVLAKMPSKYIYEPWECPKEIQRGIGCVIGKDYPHPIVDHAIIHKTNIQRMKTAYANGKTDKAEPQPKDQPKIAPAKKRKSPSTKPAKVSKKQPKIDVSLKKLE